MRTGDTRPSRQRISELASTDSSSRRPDSRSRRSSGRTHVCQARAQHEPPSEAGPQGGAVVDAGNYRMYTPLHIAARMGASEVVAVLLAAGGRVDGPDGTPLRYGKNAFINRGFVATGGWPAPELRPWLEEFAGGGDIPEGV